MRLRPLLLLSLSLAMACGSSTDNSTPSYDVTVSNRVETGTTAGQNRVNTLTLTVKDDNGQVVASNPIIFQLSAGTVVPNNPVTNVSGQATVTWTIVVADQIPGRLEGLAYCAPVAGKSFCKTNLSGPDKITTQF